MKVEEEGGHCSVSHSAEDYIVSGEERESVFDKRKFARALAIIQLMYARLLEIQKSWYKAVWELPKACPRFVFNELKCLTIHVFTSFYFSFVYNLIYSGNTQHGQNFLFSRIILNAVIFYHLCISTHAMDYPGRSSALLTSRKSPVDIF